MSLIDFNSIADRSQKKRQHLTAQAEIRKTVLDAALNSSQPAILQMLKYFKQADEDNIEAFEL
jgi:hypothetical protein